MSVYTLHPYKKGGNYLMPGATMNTEEYVRDTYSLSLVESLVEDEDGDTVHRYRLYSKDYMRFTDTLDYDIGCPRCQSSLRLCGLPVDANTHGLYKCRACDERSKR